MPEDLPPVPNVYQDQMTTLSQGLALWNPTPPKVIYDKVSIGDVGYLHEGSFVRMFNVILPWNHESNRTLGEPEPYESLDCGPFANTIKRKFDRVKHCSRYVSAETILGSLQVMTPNESEEGVTYRFRNSGALLSLPNGGYHEDVIRAQPFEHYVQNHVDSWFTWAQKNLLGVARVEDLILVSGCTLVTSWAAAAFADDTSDAEISLASRTLNNSGASFVWSNIRGSILYHNSRFEPSHGNQSSTMAQDQCVFVRGFRVTGDKMQVIRVSSVPEYDDPNISVVDTIGLPIQNENLLMVGSSSSLDTIGPPSYHKNSQLRPYSSSITLPSNGGEFNASLLTSPSYISSIVIQNYIVKVSVTTSRSKSRAANGTSKRTHALIELIVSERAYASDLALIRNIHLPVALGNGPPIPTPPNSSSLSLRTLSNASDSSTTSLGPPMTRDDARTIFSNLPELAEFADDFVSRLEPALGNVLPSGEGEDRVGALFIEMIPLMKSPYMHYITHHPVSLTRLNSLPQTPALAAYHATTRTLAQQLSNAWDLSSLLIKPVLRLLNYTVLLNAIIEATPDSHGDKENLRRAKSMVDTVSHAINESQRRREIVKEVFAAGKPAELLKKRGLGMGRVRGGVTTPRSVSLADSEETERLMRMERNINLTTDFIQKFAKETVEWVKTIHVLMSALHMWAEGFGRVIGLGPDVTSEAFDAFLVVVDKQLVALCNDLTALVEEQLLPQLRVLLGTGKRPGLLIESLHALEPHHYALQQHNPAKGRPPPALSEASIAFVALRAQLLMELPAYLSTLHDGVTLCVGQVIRWQARLWRDVRTRWSDLWDALRVEGEMNAGNEETERVWRVRWGKNTQDLYKLNIIQIDEAFPQRKRSFSSSPNQARYPYPNTRAHVNRVTSHATVHRHARRPSTESLHSISSARSSSGDSHYVDASEHTPSPPRHAMSLHHSQEEPGGRGGGGKRSPHPPYRQHSHMPSMPQLVVAPRWYRAPPLYTCRVVHECEPPEGVEYYGLPFFKLVLDDVYQVLKEAGHPSRHRDLPVLVDEGEDCLILARDSGGELGWLLASFLFPID